MSLCPQNHQPSALPMGSWPSQSLCPAALLSGQAGRGKEPPCCHGSLGGGEGAGTADAETVGEPAPWTVRCSDPPCAGLTGRPSQERVAIMDTPEISAWSQKGSLRSLSPATSSFSEKAEALGHGRQGLSRRSWWVVGLGREPGSVLFSFQKGGWLVRDGSRGCPCAGTPGCLQASGKAAARPRHTAPPGLDPRSSVPAGKCLLVAWARSAGGLLS